MTPLVHERSALTPPRDCGPGWDRIIDTLLEQIEAHRQVSPELPDFRHIRIKEKFGELRVQIPGCDEYIAGMIRMASAMSLITCECCGEPGTLAGLQVRCDAHRRQLESSGWGL